MSWLRVVVFIVAAMLAACAPVPVQRGTAPATPGAPPAAPPATPTPPAGPAAPSPAVPATPAPQAAVRPFPSVTVPPNALYVCVHEDGGTLRQTSIDYEPKVAELCRRHPEMGPCQYEREACRRRGGRVIAANGTEVTAATEAEYDRKVTRIRFRAN